MDAGGRAPTLGALGDAGAVAESLSKPVLSIAEGHEWIIF